MNSVLKAWGDLPPIFADRLMALLSAPGRRMRGLCFVNQLLCDADRLCHPHWLKPLRWAILYHAAVHDPLAPARENQRACAELWMEHFPALHETVWGVSAPWEHQVTAAIEACAAPFQRPDGFLPWQHALLDLGLGWLGEAEGFYHAARSYALAAHEDAGGNRADWLAARQRFLTDALAGPTLFHAVHRDREAQARINIRRDLAAM